jgi:hypothetical protein
MLIKDAKRPRSRPWVSGNPPATVTSAALESQQGVMSHADCSPECLSEVTRFVCWQCGTTFGEPLHWRQDLPEFRDCAECLERGAAATKEV